MTDFVLTFLSATVWGDLSLISSGAMVASGEENFYLDYLACLLGINFHDFFFFQLGFYFPQWIQKIGYLKKRIDVPEILVYKNFFLGFKLSKFLRYKFISKLYLSLPLVLGMEKCNSNQYYKSMVVVNFLYASSIFFVFYYLNIFILQLDLIPMIPKITGVLLSLGSYILYLFISKIVIKENR